MGRGEAAVTTVLTGLNVMEDFQQDLWLRLGAVLWCGQRPLASCLLQVSILAETGCATACN
jgi:hypothetical protein